VLKPNITPIGHAAGSVATHGSPWDYDRRVPILFWRPGMQASLRDDAIETVDIMPTLAAMIGLPLDAGSTDGHCLQGVDGVACPR
jgi:arylsulfatase A-like enzyme